MRPTQVVITACPHCGAQYHRFRTGLTYRAVYEMLWSYNDEDTSTWKYKRRHTILGYWHMLKKQMWDEHLYVCEQSAHYALNDEPPF